MDLDDSDVEDSSDEPAPAVQVNSAVIDRLMARREPDFQAYIPPPDSSKALVLFKPVIPPGLGSNDAGVKVSEEPASRFYDGVTQDPIIEDCDVDVIPIDEDDAMDIE